MQLKVIEKEESVSRERFHSLEFNNHPLHSKRNFVHLQNSCGCSIDIMNQGEARTQTQKISTLKTFSFCYRSCEYVSNLVQKTSKTNHICLFVRFSNLTENAINDLKNHTLASDKIVIYFLPVLHCVMLRYAVLCDLCVCVCEKAQIRNVGDPLC
jgi:hypothetical protein